MLAIIIAIVIFLTSSQYQNSNGCGVGGGGTERGGKKHIHATQAASENIVIYIKPMLTYIVHFNHFYWLFIFELAFIHCITKPHIAVFKNKVTGVRMPGYKCRQIQIQLQTFELGNVRQVTSLSFCFYIFKMELSKLSEIRYIKFSEQSLAQGEHSRNISLI